MTRLPVALAALPALALVRLLPASGAGLALRLALATALVLAPGALIARALNLRGAAATLALGFAAIFVALALTFALRSSLTLTLALLALEALLVLPVALSRPRVAAVRGGALVLAAGCLFGLLLWHVAAPLDGDALFHLARVRKLDSLGSLSLRRVDEFRDGGLHPGYAFPLWHGFLALVARVGGLDGAAVVRHEATVLAPLAFLLAYEAGVALFRSALAGAAALTAQVALIALAPGHGGSYTALALPATASRQLLVPAVLALVFVWLEVGAWALLAAIAAGGLALALVHPTYALFVFLPLGGFLGARLLLARSDGRRLAAALAALALPTAGVVAWLTPIVRETVSHTPSAPELRRALAHYAGQIDVLGEGSYRLSPQVLARGGAVAVLALALVPLAGLAARRRWAAYVLGGSLAVLAITLAAPLFTRFSDAVSLSQSRRAAGFLPFAFAFAGGLGVAARWLRLWLLPLALVTGVLLQVLYPGDFGYRFQHGGPALATWIAAAGGAVALLAASAAFGRRPDAAGSPPLTALAALLFVLPVGVHAGLHWSPRPDRNASPLTPGLVAALRHDVPRGDVVFSDLETSYRIAAFAPVYVAAAPPAHVADTRANRPYRRRDDVQRFIRTGDLAIPRSYGAGWLVLDRTRTEMRPPLEAVYADGRYTLLRLPR